METMRKYHIMIAGLILRLQGCQFFGAPYDRLRIRRRLNARELSLDRASHTRASLVGGGGLVATILFRILPLSTIGILGILPPWRRHCSRFAPSLKSRPAGVCI
jgi:hypothetical protein